MLAADARPAGVRTIEEQVPDKLLVHLDTQADRDETVHRLLVDLMAGGCRVRSFNRSPAAWTTFISSHWKEVQLHEHLGVTIPG